MNLYKKAFNSWRGINNFESENYSIGFMNQVHTVLKKNKKQLAYEKDIFTKSQTRIVNIRFEEYTRENRKRILRDFIKEWRLVCPTPIPWKRESINIVPKDPYHVVTKLTIDESGHVKVSVKAPLEKIYKKYFANLKKPPLEEYIIALEEFGYPQWVINKLKIKLAKEGNNTIYQGSIFEQVQYIDKISKSKKKQKSTLDKFRS